GGVGEPPTTRPLSLTPTLWPSTVTPSTAVVPSSVRSPAGDTVAVACDRTEATRRTPSTSIMSVALSATALIVPSSAHEAAAVARLTPAVAWSLPVPPAEAFAVEARSLLFVSMVAAGVDLESLGREGYELSANTGTWV